MQNTENTPETDKIDIDQNALKSLNTLRKWTMFHAILGFIFLGLFVITGAIAGTFLTAFFIPILILNGNKMILHLFESQKPPTFSQQVYSQFPYLA